MNLLNKIVENIIAVFSPMMRDTLELQKLNGLWERFNNGEDVKVEVLNYKWKYHQDKVNLLLTFINITN